VDELGAKTIYEEAGRAWIHFVTWRERIFAGYLTVLAALGVAFHAEASPLMRLVVCGACILVSVVFWILDLRNRELIGACQAAAQLLEDGKGAYSALNSLRFDSTKRYTHGLAINLLVCSVVGGSVGAIVLYSVGLAVGDRSTKWNITLCGGIANVTFPGVLRLVALVIALTSTWKLVTFCEQLGWRQKLGEKAKWEPPAQG
jgi:hypothetical protein